MFLYKTPTTKQLEMYAARQGLKLNIVQESADHTNNSTYWLVAPETSGWINMGYNPDAVEYYIDNCISQNSVLVDS